MEFDIKDINLYKEGVKRIEWALKEMPVLMEIRNEFKRTKPLKNLRIAACLHITTETANLLITLKTAGAVIRACASNPLSTQDDVAAAAVKEYGIEVFAVKGESTSTYYKHIDKVLDLKPNITMDDGADLITRVHRYRRQLLKDIIGGTEETTTGVTRLKAMAEKGVLEYPVIAVNDADTKHLFDNRYGTGQSTIDGILRATNILIAGKYFVVCGYGNCGRGVAMRARGLGAKVVVTEVDPVKALEAVMDGYIVMPVREAAKIGDFFVTVTGNKNVISKNEFLNMKDGAVIANAGHFDVEIDKNSLEKIKIKKRRIRDFVEEYTLKNNKRIYLLAEGRLVNLASAEGHPASVMDMSFSNQAYSVVYIKNNAGKLKNRVYRVPAEIDKKIARIKLRSMGVKIDTLTPEQKKYISGWEEGT